MATKGRHRDPCDKTLLHPECSAACVNLHVIKVHRAECTRVHEKGVKSDKVVDDCIDVSFPVLIFYSRYARHYQCGKL